MSSVTYLREQFSKLQTDVERNMFCYKIINVEYWRRDREQIASLPHGFLNDLLNHLLAALRAEGRGLLYDRFANCVGQLYGRGFFGIYCDSHSINKEEFINLLCLLYHDQEKRAALPSVRPIL